MRKKIKIFLFSVMAILLLCSSTFLRSPPGTVRANDSNSLYTEKVVAVVYDNSGSMNQEKRSPNAKYALQALVSIFDSDDTMSIFPLNPSTSSEGIAVDLSSDNRDAVIDEIIANKRFTPGSHNSGIGTPPEAVGYATDWLANMGMNKLEPVYGKEYWLVILSDGDFTSSKNTSTIIREEISGYIGLQTIYFGISASEKMKIDDLVKENSAVTAYYTDGTDDIISAMRELSNQVTGRYTLPKGVSINGNKVEIDLKDCSFSISSIAVLAEADDPDKNIELTNIDCATVDLTNKRACSISIHEDKVNKSGYSSVILPKDSDKYLNKDFVTLTFNTKIKTLSVLVEPSIILDSELQYLNSNNEWEEITVDVINTSFKKGETIKPVFKLLDGKTGKNLTNVLGDVQASVSYNGKTYNYNQGFNLEVGKKEVSLSVTIDIGGSKYVLYNSWLCDIDENPNNFRVVSNVTKDYNGNKGKVKVDYTVYSNYSNDKKLTADDFSGTSPKYTWELIELKDPRGNDFEYESCLVNSDGTISLIYKYDQNLFGSYSSKIKVVCEENKRYRFGESQLNLEIQELVLSQGSGITLTTNQVIDNTSAIEFMLTTSGQDLPFSNSMIGYELKVGGMDVTKKATINGNVLRFVPNSDNLSSTMLGVGERNVELKVWLKDKPSITASSSCKLSIINSTYVVEVVEENNKVDIYNLANCKAKLKYRISLDGEYFTTEELRKGLESGQITLSYKKFGWELLLPPEVTTEIKETNGEAYIECSLNTSWWKPISSLVSSFIITGEKAVTVEIAGRNGIGSFDLTPVGIFSRIWRWVVILLILYVIVHIILWIIGFFIAKPLPKGFIVKIIMGSFAISEITLKASKVNFEKKLKIIWHIKRFIPFKEFMNQPLLKVSKVQFIIDENKQERMFTVGDIYEYSLINSPGDDNYDELIDLIGRCRKYNPKTKGKNPKLSKPIKTKPCEDLFDDKDKLIPSKQKISIGGYFARKDDKGKLIEILFFVKSL